MMESNSEMKIEKNMEPKLSYTRKEKFNDSFFIRKPIVNEVNSEKLKVNNDQTSFAFSYTQPHSMKANSTQVTNLNLTATEAGENINSYSTHPQNERVNYSPFTIHHSPHKKTAFMKRFLRNHFLIAITLVIANLFLASVASAQITSTATGGLWSAGTTWVGGVVPTAGQNVIIATTGTNQVDIQTTITQTGSVTVNNGARLTSTNNGPHTFGSLIINAGGLVTMNRALTVTGTTSISGTIIFGSTSTTARAMVFTGDVTLNAGAVWTEATNGSNGDNDTYSFGGNFTNNATTFTATNNAAAIHTFTGTAKTISGTTATAIPFLTINGTTTNNGTLTVSGALAGSSTLTQGNGSTLNIGGTSAITGLDASTVTNTVQYNATTGGQTVKAGTYYNLTLSNTSGTETAGGNLTVNNALTTTSGGTLNMGTNQLLGTLSTITNNGTIQTQNTSATPIPTGKTWGGTMQYNATTGGQTVMTGTYNNLTLSNTSGTETASGALTVNGTLITTGGGTLNMGANQLLGTISTITNGGTIQTQNISATPIPTGKTWGGTVQYNATTGGQTVMAGTYNNLTLSNTSSTQTASGALTVNGTLTTAGGGTLNMGTNQLLGTLSTITNGGTIQTQNTSATPIPTGKTWGGTVQYNATTGGQTVMAGTYSNLTLSNTSGTQTASGAVTVNGTLTTTGGGTLNMVTNQLLGTLSTISNGGTIQTQNTTATPIPTGKTWGGTVEYNATTGGQTVVAGTYSNLTLSNTSGTQTASGALTVNGTLITPANGILNMGANQLLGTLSTITNGGTIQTQNTSATPIPTGKTWSGTIQYNATTGGQTVMAGTYNNLTLSNTNNTQTASGDLTVNGTLTTTAGGTLNMVTNQLLGTLSTITNGGTIQTQNISATPIPTGRTWGGTVQFNAATGGQTVMAGTYNNLTLSNSSGTQTAENVLTINGALSMAGGSVLNLGTFSHTASSLSIAGIAQNSGTYGGSNTSGATYILPNHFSATSGLLTVGTSTCVPGTWLGTASTDWFDPANWCGGVPTSTTDVIIPSSTPSNNMPVIDVQDGVCRNITLGNGSSLTIIGSHSLTVSGSWTNNGGTFSANSSTVTFNGTSSQAINGTATSQTFYNLVVNSSATLSTGGSTTTLTVNDFTEAAGGFSAPATFNVNGNFLYTSGTFTPGANLNLKGNWTNNGSDLNLSTGTVTFNNTLANQNIDGSAATQSFNNITLAKASGTNVTVAILITGINVAGTFTFSTPNSGVFITNISTLFINNTLNTAIAGGGTNAYIDGPVRWTLPSNLSTNVTYTFPVGSVIFLPFALVNPTTGSGVVTAQVQAFNANAGGTVDATLNRYQHHRILAISYDGQFYQFFCYAWKSNRRRWSQRCCRFIHYPKRPIHVIRRNCEYKFHFQFEQH
jgi:hypothetical protein